MREHLVGSRPAMSDCCIVTCLRMLQASRPVEFVIFAFLPGCYKLADFGTAVLLEDALPLVQQFCFVVKVFTFLHGSQKLAMLLLPPRLRSGEMRRALSGAPYLFRSLKSSMEDHGTRTKHGGKSGRIMAPELLGRRPYGLNCDVWLGT